MTDQIERLVTVWDANFQKLDEKLNKINARHHAVARQMKKDADTFTGQLEQRYGALGKAMGNVFNDSRLAVMDAGSSRLRVFGSALEPLGVAGLAAAAGIAAVAAAAGQTVNAMRFADEIDDTAQKLNIGTDALQEFRFAMTEVGGEAKDADQAIADFNKVLGAAQSGLSPRAMKGFKALGIDKETLDSWASFEDAIPEISRKIGELGKESERAAVAEKLGLGSMLPLLRDGTEEMERLRQKAQDLGIVMDAELVAKGAQANQEFETLSSVIRVQLTSAFVELSDEVVAFTGFVADALSGLNDFIETFNRWRGRANALYGEDTINALFSGDADRFMNGAINAVGSGRTARAARHIRNGDSLPDGRTPTAEEMRAFFAAPARNPSGRLTDTSARGGGRSGRGRNTAEQRERRQEQFDREMERVQAELLRARDHQFESIRSDAANKLIQLEAEHARNLADIVRREEEYIRSDGLRGLAKAEADQLRAAQDELTANKEATVRWEERQQLDDYRLRLDQEAIDQTIEMLGIQAELAITGKDRAELERRILAEQLRAERDRQRAELANDPNIDDTERARRLAQGDRNRSARYDAAARQSEGAQDARSLVADLRAPDSELETIAEMYAEIDRLRQEDVISEDEAARAKAAIDIRYREARLESTRTMLDTLASLQSSSNKKLAAIGKAAAIAQATIDGVLAVQKALASAPPPLNFVQAAIVGAVAAANVAQIAGFERGGYTGNGGTKAVAGVVHGQEYVFDAVATRRIGVPALEALRRGAPVVDSLNRAHGSMSLTAPTSGAPITFAPTIDARGADMAAVARLERVLDEQRRSFTSDVRGVMARRGRYKTGTRG